MYDTDQLTHERLLADEAKDREQEMSDDLRCAVCGRVHDKAVRCEQVRS